MIPRNCLSEVLDRINREGGYFVSRLSEHWRGMHVLWLPPVGEIEHYAPPEKLNHPAEALIGFEGAWIVGDKPERAKPVPKWSLVWNAWVLAIGVTAWAGWRAICRK